MIKIKEPERKYIITQNMNMSERVPRETHKKIWKFLGGEILFNLWQD